MDRLSAPVWSLRRPPAPAAPRAGERILLVRADHVGDLLLATPAIAALRTARAGARIDVLASPWGAPALAGNPHVDRVLALPATWYEAARAGTLRLADLRRARRAVARGRYDGGVDLRGDPRVLLLLIAGGVRCRVGPAGLGLEGALGASVELDAAWDHRRRNLEVAALLGADAATAPELPVLQVGEAARRTGRERLEGVPRPRVVIAPGTNRPRHSWGAERFAESARRLVAAGGGVVLVGREADRAATAAVRNALGGVAADLTGDTDLETLAGVLAAADLLVANDSGVVHVAAAASCPVVAVFGATDPALSFPWPPRSGRALAEASTCARPCFRRDCPEDHGYDLLDPARVAEAGQALLAARGVA
jgi:lipopolysaccharide heptosyltransferase II